MATPFQLLVLRKAKKTENRLLNQAEQQSTHNKEQQNR